MATAEAIVTNALRRARIIDQYAPIPADDLAVGLSLMAEMIDGWAADGITIYGSFEGTTASGNTEVTNIDVRDVARLFVGMLITGTGIQALTRIDAISSSTSITLSLPATATNADIQLGYSDLPVSAKLSRWLTACLGVFACQQYGVDPNDLLAKDAEIGERLIRAEYKTQRSSEVDNALLATQSTAFTSPFGTS
jgi:hypothetical protein